LLVRFGRHCIEAKVGIVTFNYDDFLDEALWRVKSVIRAFGEPYWHPDGGYGFFCRPSPSTVTDTDIYRDRSTALFKLHGSMNWRPILGARRP
jgi:SIR2-like domain